MVLLTALGFDMLRKPLVFGWREVFVSIIDLLRIIEIFGSCLCNTITFLC